MGLAEQFFQLYRGLPRAHGVYTPAGKDARGKVTGSALTVTEAVTVEKWDAHLDGTKGLGVVPIMDDGNCWWAAIDIDVYPLDIPALEDKVRLLELPLIPCRTKSGGCHLYTFFAEPLSADLVRSKMMMFAASLGYPQVEIFPKQIKLASEKDVGNWINMPYFDLSNTERYAIVSGNQVTAEAFLERAFKLKEILTSDVFDGMNPAEADEFDDGPPCLQALASTGFPQGTRNNGLFALGVYCRLKYADLWQIELDRMNQKYMKPPLGTKEVMMLDKSLSRKEYHYPCKQPPIANVCNRLLCKKREFGISNSDPDDPQVEIGRLVKIKTDPPTWIIDVDRVRMEISTQDLVSQERFKLKCIEAINKMPLKIKPKTWTTMIQDRLANVEEIEAPVDAGADGQFWTLVCMFAFEGVTAGSKEEILLGRPWVSDNRTFFRSSDLDLYLKMHQFKDLGPTQRWASLRRRGAEHHQLQIAARNVQCWSLPGGRAIPVRHHVPDMRDE